MSEQLDAGGWYEAWAICLTTAGPIDTIPLGSSPTPVGDPSLRSVSSSSSLQALWTQLQLPGDVPELRFDRWVVVAVAIDGPEPCVLTLSDAIVEGAEVTPIVSTEGCPDGEPVRQTVVVALDREDLPAGAVLVHPETGDRLPLG